MTARLPALVLPSAFIVFERVDSVSGMNQRSRELYAWAGDVGVPILDDMAAWHDDAFAEHPSALRRAVHAARLEHAALLVHSVEIISREPLAVAAVLRELGTRELWTPYGRVFANVFGEINIIGLPGKSAREEAIDG